MDTVCVLEVIPKANMLPWVGTGCWQLGYTVQAVFDLPSRSRVILRCRSSFDPPHDICNACQREGITSTMPSPDQITNQSAHVSSAV